MERHLKTFVGILVVHVVDGVQRIHINAGQPLHYLFKLLQDFIEGKVITLNSSVSRRHLFSSDFISASVDRIQKTLREICSCSEKLHLFADQHWRYTTRDSSVISPRTTHDLVAFKLNRAGVNSHLGGKTSEAFGQPW